MIKKVIVGLGLVGMVAFSGCSDTKESIEADGKALLSKCISGELSKDECKEQGKEIDARMKAFNESAKNK